MSTPGPERTQGPKGRRKAGSAANAEGRTEHLLQLTEAVSKVGTWEIDLRSGENWWSDELFRICGLEPGSVAPTTELGLQVIHPADRERSAQAIAMAMEQGVPYVSENRVLRPDGSIRLVRVQSHVIRNADGAPVKIMGIVQDVTERVDRERELAQHSITLENAEVLGRMGTWELHPDTGLMRWSDEHARICGFQPGAIAPDLSFLLERLVHPEDRERAMGMIDGLRKGIPYEGVLRYRAADGTTMHMQVKAHQVQHHMGAGNAILGVVRDITEEVEREQELQKVRIEQEALINSTTDLIWSVGKDYRIMVMNKAFADIVHMVGGGSIRPGDHALIPAMGEAYNHEWRERYQRAFLGERFNVTFRTDLPEGPQHYLVAFNPIVRHGEVRGVACLAKDVTMEIRSREQLSASEAKYRMLFQDSPLPIWVFDREDHRIVDVNGTACAHYGYSREEFLNMTLKDLIVDGHWPAWSDDDAIATDRSGPVHFGLSTHKCSNGGAIRMDMHGFPIDYEGRNGMMVTCLDVTERERGLERLAQSEADLRRAQETAKLGVWKLEADTGVLRWSDTVYNIWEREHEFSPTLDVFFASVHPDDREVLRSKLALLMKGEGAQEQAHRILLPGGRIKWVYEKAEPVTMVDGRPVVNGIVQDITEQRDLEDLLSRSSKLSRTGSWELDATSMTLYWSPLTREIHEVGSDHVPDLDSAILFYKDDGSRETIQRVVQEAMTHGTPWDVEVLLIAATGRERWVRTIGHAEFLEGRVVRLLGSIQDIHSRKTAEIERLNAVEERDNILDRVKDAFIGLTADWRVSYWNPMAAEMLGRSREQMLGAAIWDHFPDAGNFRANYERAMRTQEPGHFEEYYAAADKWFEVSAYPSPDGLSVFFRDVTERRRAQAERERLVQALDRSLNELYFFDARTLHFTHLNHGALRNIGYGMEEIRSMTPLDLKPAFSLERFQALVAPLRTGELEQVHFETFHKRKDGSTYPVEVFLELHGHGDQGMFMAVILDTSQRDRLREEMNRSNERFQLVSKATKDAIWDWDILHGHMQWSESFRALCGYDRANEPPLAKYWYHLVHPDDRDSVRESLRAVLDDPEQDLWQFEYRLQAPAGPMFFVSDRGVVMRDGTGKAVRMVGALQDITGRKEQEAHLRRLNIELEESNKQLEQFAYVASHDLQEPLRMISGFLTLLEKRIEDALDEKSQDFLKRAVDGAERMRRVILDLLEYSHAGRDQGPMEPVDLQQLMGEVRDELVLFIAEKKAELRWSRLPTVLGARIPLGRVLQNLISNALKYARPGVAPKITVEASEEPGLWRIAVVDNGIGIEPQYHEKIFEVFQRLDLKSSAGGNGIGLAICRKIIEAHGGRIGVVSQPDQGSTFHFTVPKEPRGQSARVI